MRDLPVWEVREKATAGNVLMCTIHIRVSRVSGCNCVCARVYKCDLYQITDSSMNQYGKLALRSEDDRQVKLAVCVTLVRLTCLSKNN